MKKLVIFAVIVTMSLSISGVSYAGGLLDALGDLVNDVKEAVVSDEYDESELSIPAIVAIVSNAEGKMDGALNLIAYLLDVLNDGEETELSGVLRSVSELVRAFKASDLAKISSSKGDVIDSIIKDDGVKDLSTTKLWDIYDAVYAELLNRGELY